MAQEPLPSVERPSRWRRWKDAVHVVWIFLDHPGPFSRAVFPATHWEALAQRIRAGSRLVLAELGSNLARGWVIGASGLVVTVGALWLNSPLLPPSEVLGATVTLLGLATLLMAVLVSVSTTFRTYPGWTPLMLSAVWMRLTLGLNGAVIALCLVAPTSVPIWLIIPAWTTVVRAAWVAMTLADRPLWRELVRVDLIRRLRWTAIRYTSKLHVIGWPGMRAKHQRRVRWVLAVADRHALAGGVVQVARTYQPHASKPECGVLLTADNIVPRAVIDSVNHELDQQFVFEGTPPALTRLSRSMRWYAKGTVDAANAGEWDELEDYLRDYQTVIQVAAQVDHSVELQGLSPYIGRDQVVTQLPVDAFLRVTRNAPPEVVERLLRHIPGLLAMVQVSTYGLFHWSQNLVLPLIRIALHREPLEDALLITRSLGAHVGGALLAARTEPNTMAVFTDPRVDPIEAVVREMRFFQIKYDAGERRVRQAMACRLLWDLVADAAYSNFNTEGMDPQAAGNVLKWQFRVRQYVDSATTSDGWTTLMSRPSSAVVPKLALRSSVDLVGTLRGTHRWQ